ncbi:PRD domain-containing protein [Enterococcus gilvus]|uniref:PRD domain-containing protein n=1 Tax=Enterococcus gilvus TaxID=160453 RepID=UPI00345E9FBC
MKNAQLSTQRSNASDRQFIRRLADLAKRNYALTDNFYLANNLSYFLFNAAESIPMPHIFPISTIEIMENLFKSEVAFAKKAVEEIEDYLQQPLKKTDSFVLTEAVIAANYQLNINEHEQEKFLQLIHSLLTQIIFHVQIPRADLFLKAPRLMRHLKFLALHILKEKQEAEASDNDLYFYVSERYTHEFHAANQIRVFVTETYDFDLSNDEISYLILHFRVLRKLEAY